MYPFPILTFELGTVGLWVSGSHDWSVLCIRSIVWAICDHFMACILGIWPWFGMAFGSPFASYVAFSPILFALYPISLTLAEQIPFDYPTPLAPVCICTSGLCKSMGFGER